MRDGSRMERRAEASWEYVTTRDQDGRIRLDRRPATTHPAVVREEQGVQFLRTEYAPEDADRAPWCDVCGGIVHPESGPVLGCRCGGGER